MNRLLYEKIKNNPKMYDILKHNSYYIKELNRDPNFYKKFQSLMKDKYKIRITDKINDALDNIDLISNVFDALQ